MLGVADAGRDKDEDAEIGHPDYLRAMARGVCADSTGKICPHARLEVGLNENITLNMQYLQVTAESRT